MAGYTKLFSSIVTSTIWCEDNATLRVWIAMLAMADSKGKVEGSVPGFAHIARVTVDEMRRAIGILESPDPDSRTPDHQGRRIIIVPGGWVILNYTAYRESRDPDVRREQNREAQERHRRKSAMSANVSQVSAQAEAEAKAEAKPSPADPAGAAPKPPRPIPDNPVNRLQEVFRVCLEKADGAEAKFNYGLLGKVVKERLKTLSEQEIEVRIRNWFASTDTFLAANRNNVGVFAGKFHHLKGGPIHGKAGEKPKNGFRTSGGHDARQPAGGGGSVPAKGGGGGVVL